MRYTLAKYWLYLFGGSGFCFMLYMIIDIMIKLMGFPTFLFFFGGSIITSLALVEVMFHEKSS